jgi:putative transport protein
MLESLLQNSYFSVFVIIALGFLLGNVKIKGVSLDSSAVLFVALLFGHFGVEIPKVLGNFGLVLFIFTIGIQSGPGFFDSFKKNGKNIFILSVLIIASSGAAGIGLGYLFNIDTEGVLGLISGALSSTPALATATDLTDSPLVSIAYGITYPFSVIGIILFVKLFPRIFRVDLAKEAKKIEEVNKEFYPEVKQAVFKVKNPTVFGKTLAKLQVRSMTGAVISRYSHEGVISLAKARTKLYEGDLIKAVGTENSLSQLELLIGEKTDMKLPVGNNQVSESLLVTNKNIVDQTLGSLNLTSVYSCNVTYIRRSGVMLSPSPDIKIKFGDKLVVVGEQENVKEVGMLLGNDEKKLSSTDFFPIALGIILGILAGQIQLSFSDSFTFSLGLTGGVLIVALLLSKAGKTGSILWTMSDTSNQLLRQLGLLLFLAEVGTTAGATLIATFQTFGLLYFFIGIVITLVPMILSGIVGKYVLKLNALELLSTIIGGMTSTPGLAAVGSMTDSNVPNLTYASAYPLAMVLLIIMLQVIGFIAL